MQHARRGHDDELVQAENAAAAARRRREGAVGKAASLEVRRDETGEASRGWRDGGRGGGRGGGREGAGGGGGEGNAAAEGRGLGARVVLRACEHWVGGGDVVRGEMKVGEEGGMEQGAADEERLMRRREGQCE